MHLCRRCDGGAGGRRFPCEEYIFPASNLIAMSTTNWMETDEVGIKLALEQAHKSYNEGGIPIGCSIVASDGTVLGVGHNERIQKSSATLHGEISALENAGRLKAQVYRDATIVSICIAISRLLKDCLNSSILH